MGLDGNATAGVNVKVNLTRIQWNSVRKPRTRLLHLGNGEERHSRGGHLTVTTQAQPGSLGY